MNKQQSNASKKRNSFFNHLSIFRQKSFLNNLHKDAQLYQSQSDVRTESVPFPINRSRRCLNNFSQRPISLDLDLVKNLHEQKQQQQRQIRKSFGMKTLFFFLFRFVLQIECP